MNKVKVGIVGCGKISERASLPNLANYQDKCEVVCLCDIVKDKAEALQKKFSLKGADIVTEWKELVKRPDIDTVFVNTPNYLHEEVAVGALNCKKHVLVEKPITISTEAADNMVRAAEKNKVYIMVEQTQRFDPIHQAAKKVLDSGALGKIHNIRGRIGHAGPEYWSEGKPGWYYEKEKSGGGCMVDIGVHICDLVRYFAAKKVTEVFGTIGTLEKKIPVDDNATVLLKFADGTKGEFECSWTTRPYEVMTYCYGEKGKMVTSIGGKLPILVTFADSADGKDPNVTLKEEIPQIGSGSGWENAVHYFIDCLIKGEKPFICGEEGRETIKVILAAYESNKTGRWVKIK